MSLILVDMDGPIADFELGVFLGMDGHDRIELADRVGFDSAKDYGRRFGSEAEEHVDRLIRGPHFFSQLPVVEGARQGLASLARRHDVQICTRPLWGSPTCASDKLEWVERKLGKEWVERLIIARDKTWVRGDYLIDDKPKVVGSLHPQWEHLLFSAPYNCEQADRRGWTWPTLIDHFTVQR